MKHIEKVLGVNTADFETIMPALKAASSRMLKEYNTQTHPKLKMLDGLIVFSLLTLIAQIVYA